MSAKGTNSIHIGSKRSVRLYLDFSDDEDPRTSKLPEAEKDSAINLTRSDDEIMSDSGDSKARCRTLAVEPAAVQLPAVQLPVRIYSNQKRKKLHDNDAIVAKYLLDPHAHVAFTAMNSFDSTATKIIEAKSLLDLGNKPQVKAASARLDEALDNIRNRLVPMTLDLPMMKQKVAWFRLRIGDKVSQSVRHTTMIVTMLARKPQGKGQIQYEILDQHKHVIETFVLELKSKNNHRK